MRVARNTVVSLDVRLSDIWGNVIEESAESVQYLHGGYGDIFPIVETALEGKSKDASSSSPTSPMARSYWMQTIRFRGSR